MSKFYVYFQQSGGRDYTIGCGKLLTQLKSKDKISALREARDKFNKVYDGGKFTVTLFEVSDKTEINIQIWLEENKAEEREYEEQVTREQELELLRTLKKKYE